MRIRNIAAAALLAYGMPAAAPPLTAQHRPSPGSRAEATGIVAELRRIVSPEGIERLEQVHIGGVGQWISIRATDRRNPVLLMIHGGPGYPAMPTSWHFQRGWEEYFTVVQWDQRGAGKSFTGADTARLATTLTLPQMIADTEELVAWLRRELGTDRIFVLGHSWGSILGLTLAARRPEWLHAYIGMGQVVDPRESERRGWRFAMENARRAGDTTAVRELESIAPYALPDAPITLDHLYLQRKWLQAYGGAMYRRDGFAAEAAAIGLAPEYTDGDLAAVWTGNAFSATHLLTAALGVDFTGLTELEVPLILLNGRHDHNVSATVAAEWFARVQAPMKRLIWFERSAHEIMNEEPGALLLALVGHVRPLAVRHDHGGPLEADAAEIRRIDSAWSRALQAKDLEAVMSNYAPDAAFLAPGQPVLRGSRAIREWFDRTTATPGYSATFAPTEIVVAASRDMAYEIGTYRVTFHREDGVSVHRAGKHLVTWAKLDGRWRVTAESISGDSP